MIKGILAGAALFGLVTLIQPAQAAQIPAAIEASKTLHLSINATYPPFEYVDPATNTFKGVDIDLVDALASRLGLKVVRTNGLFEQLIPSLQTGRTDFILSGITDTPAREKTMDFVDYMGAGTNFYVLQDSPIKDPIELCGKKVGTIRSTTYPAQIKEWSDKNCVDAGKPPIEIVGIGSSPDVRLQLKQGRVEAAVQGGETIPFMNSQAGGKVYRVIGQSMVHNRNYGVAFRKTDTAFRDAVAAALQAMIDDGTYGKILAKWNLTEYAIPVIMINGEPLKK